MQAGDIKEAVRQRYSDIARTGACCCTSCGCGAGAGLARAVGYSAGELAEAPEGVVLGLGCGNPVALSTLAPGEVVLDLGAGTGLDAFLAARRVGEHGRVIGVDFSPEMVARARENAARGGFTNVEFLEGDIDKLPVPDAAVDVVISNCVINLSPDKLAVFREARRVLRPGARLLVSDLVTQGELPRVVRASVDAWCECIAGASNRHEYLELIRAAGFRDVTVVAEAAYPGALLPGIAGKIISLGVSAQK